MQIPEILAPAGNWETLETACLYGADAVYMGVRGETNLRAGAKNFGPEDLNDAVTFAHERGVRVYLTLNVYPHDHQLEEVAATARLAQACGVDAVIVADLGVLGLVKEVAPGLKIHISTQANTVNSQAVKVWQQLGASRIVLARELSRHEISKLRDATDAELEIFVHGSVCISMSGRCLISNYLNMRDANQGKCTHPCRWGYALVEEKRPGVYFPIEESDGVTHLYNSNDMCLLPVIDQVLNLGIQSLKIEGRNKTALYVGTVVSAYRRAVDAWKLDPHNFSLDPELLDEIHKVNNRGYFLGFFEGTPDESAIRYAKNDYEQTHHLAAKVLEVREDGIVVMGGRNPLLEGMQLELLSCDGSRHSFGLENATSNGVPVDRVRPNQNFELRLPFKVRAGELIRKPFSAGDKIL